MTFLALSVHLLAAAVWLGAMAYSLAVVQPRSQRFIQDERSWKRWKWVPYPIRRFTKAAARWARGPPNPRNWKIAGEGPAPK